MKRKLLLLSVVSILLFPINSAFALAVSYTNKNGVTVTEREFQFVNEFYGNDFFDEMTEIDYSWFHDLDINHRTVEIQKVYDIGLLYKDVSRSDRSKEITIAKSCTSQCDIFVNVTWKNNPSTTSFDVLGARLEGTKLVGNEVTTKMVSSSGTKTISDVNLFSNGFGTSIKLPVLATNLRIEQKFRVNKGGTVYASYQHSQQDIAQNISKSYSISANGYGGVFSFYGDALNAYDQMKGVNIFAQ